MARVKTKDGKLRVKIIIHEFNLKRKTFTPFWRDLKVIAI
jgi:hypothetical protein